MKRLAVLKKKSEILITISGFVHKFIDSLFFSGITHLRIVYLPSISLAVFYFN